MKRRKMLLAIAVSMFMLIGFLPGVAVAQTPSNANTNEVGIGISVPAGYYYPGDVINYRVRVSVPAADDVEEIYPAQQTDVNVFLKKPGGSFVQIATVPEINPGETWTSDIQAYTVMEADIGEDGYVGQVVAEAECFGTAQLTTPAPSSADVLIATPILPFLELGDFVWSDLDKDGIQDAGEPGIPDVEVNLWSAVGGSPGTVLATTDTDPDGMYLFSGLKADEYFVQFVLPVGDWFFSPQYAGTDAAIDSNSNPATGITDLINLTADDLTIDAGMFQLFENLVVSKTATGRFLRTHEWDIDKRVETELGHTIGQEEIPKIWLYEDGSGDEMATWVIDVTYVGFEDHGFNVFGNVTITNNGELDAVITGVADLLGGTPTGVDFGVVTFPYTLPVGQTLVGSYAENGEFTGTNEVTVTTERDEYEASVAIVYEDEPYEEYLDVVNIEDLSDLLDPPAVSLGTLDASTLTPGQVTTFEYDFDFAWADYDDPEPPSWEINNTATILETDQSASAKLKINWLEENLLVEKTVVTSFSRQHFWDIDKEVTTEFGHVIWDEEYPKIWLYQDGSGDETATWKVCVTYLGFEDSNFNVSGTVTITNTGTSDAVITGVTDMLGGTAITVDFGILLPYTLAPDDSLVGTYNESDFLEGDNVVTLTTEVDTYGVTEPIVWDMDDPDEESDAVVNIEDVSDLFDTVALGTLDAADLDPDEVTCFTYDKPFAWTDYDAPGPHVYENTATILETGQYADATLVINWEEEELCWGDDTAWAFGGDFANPNMNYVKNRFWGWTNGPLPEGSYEWVIYAGAAQNDIEKGTEVGMLYVTYSGGCVTVTYEMDEGFFLGETHLWVGNEELPRDRRDNFTNAPGQFPYGEDFEIDKDDPDPTESTWTWEGCGFEGEIYIAAHSVVWYPVECPENDIQ